MASTIYDPVVRDVCIWYFFLLIRSKIPKSIFHWTDVVLLLFLGLIIFSSILHFNTKSVNYLSAYLFVFSVEYFLFRLLLYLYVDIKKLLTLNSLAVTFVGAFCTFELSLQYLYYIDIQEWMYRSRPATATYLEIFSRSYGFSTEPTVVAYYFNTMGPIAVWKILQWSKKSYLAMLKSWLAIFFIVVGFFSTFSSAGYLFLLSALFLTTILVWRPKLTTLGLMKFTVIIGLMFMLIFSYMDVLIYYFEDIYRKLSFDTDYISVSTRLDALLLAADRILANLLTGIGLGMTSSLGESSAMNWYVSIISETGIITFVVISFICCGDIARYFNE